MVFNMTGNGGSGLNFDVKAYTSVDLLPESSRENTIGVVTDTAISGWVMQAEQPEGVEGMAASDVAFFADRKQTVKLYPKAVKQYVGGAWSNKEAHVYQNSAWVQFSYARLYVYNSGTEALEFTMSTQGSGTYVKNETSITLKSGTNASTSTAALATDTAISVANFTTLKARANITARNGGTCVLALRDSNNTDNVASIYLEGTGEQTASVPIDDVTDGLYRVRFTCFNGGISGKYVNADLYEIWFE